MEDYGLLGLFVLTVGIIAPAICILGMLLLHTYQKNKFLAKTIKKYIIM